MQPIGHAAGGRDAGAALVWTPAGPLTSGAATWWRVRGRNGGDIGPWSAWAKFWVTP